MAAALQTAELWSLVTDQKKQPSFYIIPPKAMLKDEDYA